MLHCFGNTFCFFKHFTLNQAGKRWVGKQPVDVFLFFRKSGI